MSENPYFTHVIVPLDGSAGAELALSPAEALAHAFGAVVILLRATTNTSIPVTTTEVAVVGGPTAGIGFGNLPPTPLITTPERELSVEDTEASGYLHVRAEELRRRGLIVFEQLFAGDPVEGILGQADLHDASMIVIAGHSRGGLERLFFGSTADDLIRRAPCPVLFIRREDDE